MTLITGKLDKSIVKLVEEKFFHLGMDAVSYASEREMRSRNFSAYSFNTELKKWIKNDDLFALFNKKMLFHTNYREFRPNQIELSEGEVGKFLNSVSELTSFCLNEYLVGVNMVRTCVDRFTNGYPAPHFHQDGFDYSCHINICRKNIFGGESKVSSNSEGKELEASAFLDYGDFVLFDDKKYFHTASKVCVAEDYESGYRDMIILDILKPSFN